MADFETHMVLPGDEPLGRDTLSLHMRHNYGNLPDDVQLAAFNAASVAVYGVLSEYTLNELGKTL